MKQITTNRWHRPIYNCILYWHSNNDKIKGYLSQNQILPPQGTYYSIQYRNYLPLKISNGITIYCILFCCCWSSFAVTIHKRFDWVCCCWTVLQQLLLIITLIPNRWHCYPLNVCVVIVPDQDPNPDLVSSSSCHHHHCRCRERKKERKKKEKKRERERERERENM